jgi:hypothetical protein
MPATRTSADPTQLLPVRRRGGSGLAAFFRPCRGDRVLHKNGDGKFPVSRCGFLRPQSKAAPGINRAAHSVPWDFAWPVGKKLEDTSDQFQLVSLDLNRQRALNRFN